MTEPGMSSQPASQPLQPPVGTQPALTLTAPPPARAVAATEAPTLAPAAEAAALPGLNAKVEDYIGSLMAAAINIRMSHIVARVYVSVLDGNRVHWPNVNRGAVTSACSNAWDTAFAQIGVSDDRAGYVESASQPTAPAAGGNPARADTDCATTGQGRSRHRSTHTGPGRGGCGAAGPERQGRGLHRVVDGCRDKHPHEPYRGTCIRQRVGREPRTLAKRQQGCGHQCLLQSLGHGVRTDRGQR